MPNIEDYIRAFDFAVVTAKVDGMLLRFSRGRDDFEVEISPVEKPTAWRNIAYVAKNTDLEADLNRKTDYKTDYSGLQDFGRFFEANFEVLRHEVSKRDWRPQAGWLRPL